MSRIHTVDGGSTVHAAKRTHRGKKAFFALKRAFDFTCAFLMLLCLLPFYVGIAIVVAIDTKGNPFFRQMRVGRHNRQFRLYKFRSMRTDAPADVATYLLENAESFITPVGAVLRKLSLDELPQIINILKGDMSFVGPRPVVPSEQELVMLRTRNHVDALRPGLTGWAQVNGRDNVTLEEKVILDTEYAAKIGVRMDFRILVRTFFQVLGRKGIKEGANPQIAASMQYSQTERPAS